MFTDPQSITISGNAKSLVRVSSTGTSSMYRTADGLFELTISHTLTKGRVRTMAKLLQKAIVPDPLTSVNDYETLQTYFVTDRPEVGYSDATIDAQWAGLKTWLSTATNTKLYSLES